MCRRGRILDDLRTGLTVAMNAAITLFQTIGIPRKLVVVEYAAVLLKIEAFAGCVGREEQIHAIFLEASDLRSALGSVHPTREHSNASSVAVALQEFRAGRCACRGTP